MTASPCPFLMVTEPRLLGARGRRTEAKDPRQATQVRPREIDETAPAGSRRAWAMRAAAADVHEGLSRLNSMLAPVRGSGGRRSAVEKGTRWRPGRVTATAEALTSTLRSKADLPSVGNAWFFPVSRKAQGGSCKAEVSPPRGRGCFWPTRVLSLESIRRAIGGAEAAPPRGPAGRYATPASLPSLGRGCRGRNRRGVPRGGTWTRRETVMRFYLGAEAPTRGMSASRAEARRLKAPNVGVAVSRRVMVQLVLVRSAAPTRGREAPPFPAACGRTSVRASRIRMACERMPSTPIPPARERAPSTSILYIIKEGGGTFLEDHMEGTEETGTRRIVGVLCTHVEKEDKTQEMEGVVVCTRVGKEVLDGGT